MNRRNFIRNILVAGASFNVLPGAGRLWVARRSAVSMPDMMMHQLEMKSLGSWKFGLMDYLRLHCGVVRARRERGDIAIVSTNPETLQKIFSYESQILH